MYSGRAVPPGPAERFPQPLEVHEYLWMSMDDPWISMDINGYPWISMDIHGYPWIPMAIH